VTVLLDQMQIVAGPAAIRCASIQVVVLVVEAGGVLEAEDVPVVEVVLVVVVVEHQGDRNETDILDFQSPCNDLDERSFPARNCHGAGCISYGSGCGRCFA
jgi:hypothetical protein